MGLATAWRRLTNGLTRPALVGGLAWLPLVGAARRRRRGTRSFGCRGGVADGGRAGGRRVSRGVERSSGEHSGGRLAAVKLLALLGTPRWTWTLLLVLAPMLGRWAVVVQCYGGAPAAESGAASLVGRARFREFGWASVTAIGAALVSAEAGGLAIVLGAALVTLGVRAFAYRRAQGLTSADLARTETLVEAMVLGVPAAVNALLLLLWHR